MKATLKKEEGLKREFEVSIPAKTVTTRRGVELEKLNKKAKIDGFRPGKVPADVLEKRYGPSVSMEVLDSLVKETIEKTIAENKLRPAMEPSIDGADAYEEGKDFKYSFSVEIFPEVPAIKFEDIKVEKEVCEVTDKDIDDGISRIAEGSKSFEPIKTKRKAKKGDNVEFDFLGKKDGTPFEGGEAKNFRLELGSGQFIPGFEEEMIGMEPGNEKTFPITFPKEYHSEDLAGAEVEFTVTLNNILESVDAKIDNEFAGRFGMKDVAELREKVAEQIKTDFDGVAFTKAKKSLFDVIDNKYDFPVPEGMVKLDYNSVLQQMQQEDPQGDKKEQEKEARKLAERRVRLGIILSDTGKQSGINVTNDEIRQEIMNKAASYPGQEQQIFKFYQENQNAMEQVRGEILEDKVVHFVLGKAKVTEKKVSRAELLEEDTNSSSSEPKKKASTAKKATGEKKSASKPKASGAKAGTKTASKKKSAGSKSNTEPKQQKLL